MSKELAGFEFPSNRVFTSKDLNAAILKIEKEKVQLYSEITKLLDAIKAALLTEHGADGILVVTDSKAWGLITPSDLRIRYIRNAGTRVEFFCTPVSTQECFENMLDNFKKSKPTENPDADTESSGQGNSAKSKQKTKKSRKVV